MIFRNLRNIREYWLSINAGRLSRLIKYNPYPVIAHPKMFEWLNKILGGCIYCFGTWVFIVLFLVNMTMFPRDISQFIALFLGIGFNYLFIEIIQKLKHYV